MRTYGSGPRHVSQTIGKSLRSQPSFSGSRASLAAMLLVFVGFAFAHASERDGTVRASSNTVLFESLFTLSTRRVDWSRPIRSEFSLAGA